MMTKIDRLTEMIWEAKGEGDRTTLAILEDCVSALFKAHYVCKDTHDWLMDQFNESDDEPLEEFDEDEVLLEEFDDDEPLFEEFHEDDVDEVLPCIDEDRVLEFFHTLRIGGVEIEDCTYLDVIHICQEKGICAFYAAYLDMGDAIFNLYTDDFEVARDFVAKNGCGAVCTATVLDGMLSFHDNIFELAREED